MVFSSLIFLYLFLPACLFSYFWVSSIKAKNIVLVVFSLLFYAWGEPLYILLMLASVGVNYGFGRWMGAPEEGRNGRKWIMIACVAMNLLSFVIFKYAGLLVRTFNEVFGTFITEPEIRLPIGISFFTFQAMTYVIDVYRGHARVQKSVMKFLLYISMFPQLIAGPIVRYSDIEVQLDDRKIRLDNVFAGLVRFSIGLAKKILLADHAFGVYDTLVGGGMSSATVVGTWLGVLMYMFHIYFDFSGYSDMAIGLGKMFGFEYRENFNLPYTASSITDFWRRWHISLSSFFRDYVYIPLGGNRKHQILNLLVVWSLTGLWHGASWNFLLWGLYFFVLLVLEKKFHEPYERHVPKAVRHIITLLLILFGWAIFCFVDFSDLGTALAAMFGFAENGFISTESKIQLLNNIFLILVCAIGSTPLPRWLGTTVSSLLATKNQAGVKHLVYVLITWLFCVLLLVLSTISLVGSGFSPFVYYRF